MPKTPVPVETVGQSCGLCDRLADFERRISAVERSMSEKACPANGNIKATATTHRVDVKPHNGSVPVGKRLTELLQFLQVLPEKLDAVTAKLPGMETQVAALKAWRPLARALLRAGGKTQDAVRVAIEDYLEAHADLGYFQRIAKHLPESDQKELATRGRRQVIKRQMLLRDLGIKETPVAAGAPFDPQCHRPVGQQAAESPQQADTVASVERPAFAWRDEFGLIQVEPAAVVVFVAPAEVSRRSPGANTACSRAHTVAESRSFFRSPSSYWPRRPI